MVARSRWIAATAALALAAACAMAAGCGTDATGVDQCKQIEEARCRRAAATCPAIHLAPPYTTSGTSADECIRFYDTACLHGLDTSAPSSAAVDRCVSAIEQGTCDVVQTPESSSACAWLVPQSSPADASDVVTSSSSAVDASTPSQD